MFFRRYSDTPDIDHPFEDDAGGCWNPNDLPEDEPNVEEEIDDESLPVG